MKKLFAILAVLVLFGTAAWADPAVNNFKVTVECQGPALTIEDNSIDKTLIAGVTVADLGSGSWTLKGQNGVTYDLFYKKTDFPPEAKISYTETWTGFWESAPTENDGQTANGVKVTTGSTDQCGQKVSTTVTITNAKAAEDAVAGTYELKYEVSLSGF